MQTIKLAQVNSTYNTEIGFLHNFDFLTGEPKVSKLNDSYIFYKGGRTPLVYLPALDNLYPIIREKGTDIIFRYHSESNTYDRLTPLSKVNDDRLYYLMQETRRVARSQIEPTILPAENAFDNALLQIGDQFLCSALSINEQCPNTSLVYADQDGLFGQTEEYAIQHQTAAGVKFYWPIPLHKKFALLNTTCRGRVKVTDFGKVSFLETGKQLIHIFQHEDGCAKHILSTKRITLGKLYEKLNDGIPMDQDIALKTVNGYDIDLQANF